MLVDRLCKRGERGLEGALGSVDHWLARWPRRAPFAAAPPFPHAPHFPSARFARSARPVAFPWGMDAGATTSQPSQPNSWHGSRAYKAWISIFRQAPASLPASARPRRQPADTEIRHFCRAGRERVDAANTDYRRDTDGIVSVTQLPREAGFGGIDLEAPPVLKIGC
jgi:hypothetical protein